jgi:ferredoxin
VTAPEPRKRCKTCHVDIAKRPMPHLGFGNDPMWVHVEQYVSPKSKLIIETYYRTCMSTTVAEPEDEDRDDAGL